MSEQSASIKNSTNEDREGDLDRQLKTVVALTEPVMLFLIAAFIGSIFVGMVLPIFTIQDYIN